MVRKFKISKEKLVKHLYEEKMTPKEIGEIYKVSRSSVHRLQKKYEISPLKDYQRRYAENLTDFQKEVLYGTVLGDGCLFKFKTSNYCSLLIYHSVSQKEYVELKFNIFKDFIRKKEATKFKRDAGTRYGFQSGGHPSFLEIHKYFYDRNNIKFVSQKILDKLTPMSLAFWFMDDGSRCKNGGLAIHTNSFKLEEVEMICKWLNEKYEVICKPQKRKENQYVVFFSNKTSLKFAEIILPWVLPSMRYKMKGVYLKNPQRLYAIPFCLQKYLNTEDKV